MKKRPSLPARLIAASLVLLATAAMGAAAAKDSAPPANHGEAANAPDKASPPADQTGGGVVGSNPGKTVGAGVASLNGATGALFVKGGQPGSAPEGKAHRHGCC